jgi:hypothetical protein
MRLKRLSDGRWQWFCSGASGVHSTLGLAIDAMAKAAWAMEVRQ